MDRVELFGMVLVAALGLSAGQTKNCCTPDQWQGLLSTTIEDRGYLAYADNYISYDYTNQRLASFVNFTDPSGQVSSYEDLVLYSGPNSGVQYHLDLKTRMCSMKKLSDPFRKYCVSDIAQKVGDLTLGAAAESLPVTVYSITGQNKTYQNFITVTRKLCVPVSQLSVFQFEKEVFMSVYGFADIQLGISQPSIFDVPPECKSARPLPSDKMFPGFSAKASLTSFFSL